jgi:hypothetical protein
MESVLAAAFQNPASSFPRVHLATPKMHWIVADQAGSVVGCVYAICYGEIAYIGLMAVLPHAERQGIGTARRTATGAPRSVLWSGHHRHGLAPALAGFTAK